MPNTEPYTSYEIRWRREEQQLPTTSGAPSACLYTSAAGTPLFTVVTYGALPSEGIFTLIGEAPRIRDEVAAVDRQCDEARASLTALKAELEAIAGELVHLERIQGCRDDGPDYGELPEKTAHAQQLLAKAIAAIGGEEPEDFHP